jgi:phosphoglycerate dehydrogenase-like enzyme
VSLHVPLTNAPHHLMDAQRLNLLKPTAFLINTSRGRVVDQKALTECLSAKRIAGAGLDVLEKEPPDEDDPLLKLDNVVLSARALNWTDNLDARLAESNMEAVLAVAERRDPEGVVNREDMKTTIWRDKLTRLRVISSKP